MMKRMIIANKTARAITVIGYCLLVIVLAACSGDGSQMRAQLEELERQNRADSVMTNDSLAEHLVKYFDRHGTPNERMRAHYILGRTYADMGEAPRAVDAYLDAASQADTTANDCDYTILSRVYSQMAAVYYSQNLIVDYINSLDNSINFGWKANDTSQALNGYAYKIVAYDKLKKYDMVIEMFDDFYDQFLQLYGIEKVAPYCIIPIKSLLNKGYLSKAKKYIEIIESKSGYFDADHNIVKGRENFYYYRGLYYLLTSQYDSANISFRKELQYGKDYVNQNMGSHGLSLLYTLMNKPDSAAKYAIYGYDMNDSVYAQMATKEVEQAKALYDYSHHQKMALQEHRKAVQRKAENSRLYFVIICIIAILLGSTYMWYKKRAAAIKRYLEKTKELELAKLDLHNLQSLKANMEDMASLKTKLEIQIDEHKKKVEILQEENEKYKNNELLVRKSAENLLNESETYQLLQKKAYACRTLNDEEWSELNELVKNVFPGFFTFLSQRNYLLNNSYDFKICVLFRLHIGMKDAGGLVGISKASVSRISSDVMQKLFGERGSGKELKKRLEKIT